MSERHESQTCREASLGPALLDQIEITLRGAHAFNAAMAKFDIIWAWIVKLPAIGATLAAVFSFAVGLMLVASGQDIDFGSLEIDPIHQYDWALWFAAAAGFTVLAMLLWHMTSAMEYRHRIVIEMASRYRNDWS